MALIDVHFHLLPGVDDGPATIEESVELARAAVLDGTRTVVATPHVRRGFLTDVAPIRELARALSHRLARERIPLRVVPAAELGHDMVDRLGQAELESIAIGPPGARWLLVETPFAGLDAGFAAALDELRERGFGIVLAHPERAPGVLCSDALAREVACGALLQVNAGSACGRHGADVEEAALALLRAGAVAVVASDAHGWQRMPALAHWLAAAPGRGVPPAQARRLVEGGPAALLGRGVARPSSALPVA